MSLEMGEYEEHEMSKKIQKLTSQVSISTFRSFLTVKLISI